MADVGDTPDSPTSRPTLVAPKQYDPSCLKPSNACTTTCASTSAGTTCDQDCDTNCGFANVGVKHCTCSNRTFTSCFCVPPSNCGPGSHWFECWQGATTAPSCAAYGAPTGRTAELIGKTCFATFNPGYKLGDPVPPPPYAQCVGSDFNTGTDRGCVCMPSSKFDSPDSAVWVCGSTNKWFDLP
jgi:hypothetical protein